MLDTYLALLAAIIRQAALDWQADQDQDAGDFLAAAGLIERAATIASASHQHRAIAGRPTRRVNRAA